MTEGTKQEYGEQLTITEHREERETLPEHVDLVSHSALFYWWPVWAIGFLFAALTWIDGERISVGNAPFERIHASSGLGVVYCVLLVMVVMITNISLRGIASIVVVLGGLLLTVLFAYLGVWDDIIRAIPDLTVHMNFGFYMLTSTLLFICWALTFFVFDRLTYWRIRAGQVTQERLVGGGEQSFDTHGIAFEEKHDDPFRHWLLGFGTGDLVISLHGAEPKTVYLPNVLFANGKVTKAQDLIKRKPD